MNSEITPVFIFTRGRTGSTAIIDELKSHSRIQFHGELFRPNPLAREDVRVAYEKMGENYLSLGLTNDRALPYLLHKQLYGGDTQKYLDYLRTDVDISGKNCVGFKLLGNHLETSENLLPQLSKQNAKCIHLVRKNVIKQVVSGFFAREAGIYNRRNYVPEIKEIDIPIEAFISRIKANLSGVQANRDILQKNGINYLDVYYESFCKERSVFYNAIFEFLGLEAEDLTPTDWSIMTPADKMLVSNFDDLIDALNKNGLNDLIKIFEGD